MTSGRKVERSGICSLSVGKRLNPTKCCHVPFRLSSCVFFFASQQYFKYFIIFLLVLLKATLDCWNSHLFAALEVAWLAMDGKLVSKEVSENLGAMQLYKCQIQLSARSDMNSFRNHCSVAPGDAVTPL